MIKKILLVFGIVLLITQNYLVDLSSTSQFYIFIVGIFLLGIPHGSADLLVATKSADMKYEIFSKIKFFLKYLSRLVAFAATLYFFPLIGNLLFMLFAAYHFGETDLN